MAHETAPQVLSVTMLGGFTLSWNGVPLLPELQKSSQFVLLLQSLFHAGSRGRTKAELIDLLFERDLDNPYHALQSVIYNAKQRLHKSGLPDCNYIVLHEGCYCWTDEIPVEVDANIFDRLAHDALAAEDPAEKLRLSLAACERYTGEFLPNQSTILKVSQEARRYRDLFAACVRAAAEVLRDEKDYQGLVDLGHLAAERQPYTDWETLTMEGLVALGRRDEATELYHATTARYLKEIGAPPSEQMEELIGRVEDRQSAASSPLDALLSRCADLYETDSGGIRCQRHVFEAACHMLYRTGKRSGLPSTLMLCTLANKRGRPLPEEAVSDEFSASVDRLLCVSVRKSALVTRRRKGTYLLLLTSADPDQCRLVLQRINTRFAELCSECSLLWEMRSL